MLRENSFLVSKHIDLFFANFAWDTFVCYRMLTKYLEFYDIRATGLYFSNKWIMFGALKKNKNK